MQLGTLLRLNHIGEAKEKFERLKSIGLTACQLVYKPEKFLPEDAARIRSEAEKNGITISAQFCGFRDGDHYEDWRSFDYGFLTSGIHIDAYKAERLRYLKSTADFAKLLGVTDVIVHAGYIPANPFSPEYISMWQAVATAATYLKERGMNLLFETGQEAPISLLRLIEDVGTGNLYINFDPANIYMYGLGNPQDALEIFGKYVRNCHAKDGMLPTDARHLGEERPLGEGMVDFPGIIRKFKELGYDRFIIIEREISGERQWDDIKKAKEYLEKLL